MSSCITNQCLESVFSSEAALPAYIRPSHAAGPSQPYHYPIAITEIVNRVRQLGKELAIRSAGRMEPDGKIN